MVLIYSGRFERYSGEGVTVTGVRETGHGEAIVLSEIPWPGGNSVVHADWRVALEDGECLVFDVVVEGVSMAVVQRADFGSVIQRNGGRVEGLLAALRSKTQQLAGRPTDEPSAAAQR